ncbi:hypothetical protein Pelo_17212 [Pelomyxa schiedti]|nr:hypothetical protein Pelo_17212 [Pelomyxa schiedti]
METEKVWSSDIIIMSDWCCKMQLYYKTIKSAHPTEEPSAEGVASRFKGHGNSSITIKHLANTSQNSRDTVSQLIELIHFTKSPWKNVSLLQLFSMGLVDY